MRIIPKAGKVELELLNGVKLLDIAVGGVGFIIIASLLVSDIPYKIYISIALFCIFAILLMDIDKEKGYVLLFFAVRHLIKQREYKKIKIINEIVDTNDKSNKQKSKNKKNSKKQQKVGKIEDLFDFKSIKNSCILFTDNQIGFVLQIDTMFFDHLVTENQDMLIDQVFARALRLINVQEQIQFIKLEMPYNYDEFIEAENKKLEDLVNSYVAGALSKDETAVRNYIINERIKEYKTENETNKIYVSKFFLLCKTSNKKRLDYIKDSMLEILNVGGIKSIALNSKQLAIFLKANFTKDFNIEEVNKLKESELVEWALPNRVKIELNETQVDELYLYNYRLGSYPIAVENAWGRELFNIENTRVAFYINPVELSKAVRSIDNSIDELVDRSSHSYKASKTIDNQLQLDTLQNILKLLQTTNENYFNVNTYITIYDYRKLEISKRPKDIRSAIKEVSTVKKDTLYRIKEQGFLVADSFLKQYDIFVSAFIGKKDSFVKKATGMYSSVLAASFPFVSNKIVDVGGVKLGTIDDIPAIVDVFKRDDKHVNSNMMVIGKSGSGKSYFTKVLLTNLAAENSKIFILDPEDEYSGIVDNYKGKRINLANSSDGMINPFQVIQTITDEDEYQNVQEQINFHLQFLESFFQLLLPGLSQETFEILNNIIRKLYNIEKIMMCENLNELLPTDYPTFDDLYNLIITEDKMTNDLQYKSNLRVLINYLQKFAAGGRNSILWNGYSSINSDENLIVFNFQQLLANNNVLISNAQMLLVLHWLNNEIIKNRRFNLKYNTNRKIVIIIDEAHVFIDAKHPTALDFMYNLAKRIRKYNGMQVVITQNIKDFVGTDEINRKSTAIINASQYSFIFSLAPDDMNDLCKLYEKSGGISDNEQKEIINNRRGEALFMCSPAERGIIKIKSEQGIEVIFR